MKHAATTTFTSIFTQFAVENRVIEDCPFTRELVMEAVLAENPQLLSMSASPDKTPPEVLELEKPLVKGRNVKDGRIDIVVYYPDDSTVGIVELKREVAGIKALEQLKEYTQKALDIHSLWLSVSRQLQVLRHVLLFLVTCSVVVHLHVRTVYMLQ